MPMCRPADRRLAAALPLPSRWNEVLARRCEPGIPPGSRALPLGHNGARAFSASPGFLSDGHVREARPALFTRRGRARSAREDQPASSTRRYAWEAFAESRYPRHTPRKVLFQHHPHSDFESRLLTEDFRRFPEIGRSHAEATG